MSDKNNKDYQGRKSGFFNGNEPKLETPESKIEGVEGKILYDSIWERNVVRDSNKQATSDLKKGYPKGSYDVDQADPSARQINYNNDASYPYPREMINSTLVNRFSGSAYLGPIADCISVNVAGFGYSIQARDKKIKEIPTEEKVKVDNFMRYINPRKNISQLIQQAIIDFVTVGYCCIEVIRNPYNTSNKNYDKASRTPPINALFYRPAYTFEKHPLMREAISFHRKAVYLDDDGAGYHIKNTVDTDRFRLWQQTYLSGEIVFFKEFGDPNFYHKETGTRLKTKSDIKKAINANMLATEIYVIEDKIFHGMYSVPRHFGLVDFDLRGDRSAAEINYKTTRTNGIPNLAVTGKIDEESRLGIQHFVDALNSVGTWNSSILMLRPEDPMTPDEKNDIKIEKLKDAKSDDSMFDKYRSNVHKLVRESYRIPSIVLGQETAATKEQMRSSISFAEEQVFSSIRNMFHYFINDFILPNIGVANTIVQLNTPNVTDSQSLINAVRDLEKTGAITPNISRTILETVTGLTFNEIPEEVNADVPWSGTMAEKAKNQADPTEPSQQSVSERFTGNSSDNEEQRVEE